MRNFIVSITTFIIIGALTKSMAITWPLNTTDELSSAFGPRNLHPTAEYGEEGYDYDFHAGMDIGGTGDVKAIENGTVVHTEYNGENSYFVVQSQQYSDWIMYLHIWDGPDKDATVSEGDVICEVYDDHIDIRYFYIPQYYDPQYDTPPYEEDPEIRYNLTFHPMLLFDYYNGNANYEVDFEDGGPSLGDDDKGKYLVMFGRVDDDELDLCDVEMEISNHEGDETTTDLLRGHTYKEVYVDYNWRTNCGDLYGIDSDDGDMNSNIRIIPRIFSGGSSGEDPYHTVYFRFYVDDTIIPSQVSVIDGTVFAAEAYYMELDDDDYTIYYGAGWISTSYANVPVGTCPPYCGENGEPDPPINVTAIAEPDTDMSVKITWEPDESGPGADYYLVYRRPSGTPPDNFECIGNAVYPTFRDVTGSPGKAYIYAVAGVNEIGEGMNSNDVTATMPSYGTITSQRIWKGVFVITNDVVVNSNAELTVMPGSTVKFNTGIKLRVYGTLAAEGRDFNPITFTRSGTSGSWDGIKFYSGSAGTLEYCDITKTSCDGGCAIACIYASPTITHCTISDAGYYSAGISCYNASPTIKNNTIHSFSDGIYCVSSSPTIESNTIRDNEWYGVYCDYGTPKIKDNDIYDNGSDGIFLRKIGKHRDNLRGNEVYDNGGDGIDIYNCSPYIVDTRSYYNSGNGIYAHNDSWSVEMYGYSYDNGDGGNSVAYNSANGVRENNSLVEYGEYPCGYNSFYGNSAYEVRDDDCGTSLAERCWWGTTDEEEIEEGIYCLDGWDPWLYSDPNPPISPPLGKALAGGFGLETTGSSGIMLSKEYGTLRELFARARTLEKEGAFTSALAIYEQIIRDHSPLDAALRALAKIDILYERMGKSAAEIAVDFDAIAQAYPGTELGGHALGLPIRHLIQAGRFEAAIARCKRVIGGYPEADVSREALFDLWSIYFYALKDRDQASDVLREYLDLYPADDLSLLMQVRTGMLSQAEAQQKQLALLKGDQKGVTTRMNVPEEFALGSNYPNPFNPRTTIRYDIPVDTKLTLIVYDVLGREVTRLVDGLVLPGYQQVFWNGKDKIGREVPTGIYIARMVTPEYTKSIKMALLK